MLNIDLDMSYCRIDSKNFHYILFDIYNKMKYHNQIQVYIDSCFHLSSKSHQAHHRVDIENN